eukprot:801869-Pyramimonas_sp.AAC.1
MTGRAYSRRIPRTATPGRSRSPRASDNARGYASRNRALRGSPARFVARRGFARPAQAVIAGCCPAYTGRGGVWGPRA